MCIASKYGGVVTTLLIEFGERGEILGAEETTARGHHCKKTHHLSLFPTHTQKHYRSTTQLGQKKNAKKIERDQNKLRL